MFKKLALIFTCFFALTVWAGEFATIGEQKLKELMKTNEYVIIDLRTPGEINQTGVIPGAKVKNFYDSDFGAYIKKLDKKAKYIVYCRSGGRSAKAADKMSDAGLNVTNYGGGMNGWMATKNKTEKPKTK